MESAALSVVIPTYRRAHLLPEVVAPLLADPAVREVVVVDDGSDDPTPEVCLTLSRSDPRVTVVRQENAGEAAARAAGAETASSELLLFLDDDVVATPTTATGHLCRHSADEPLRVVLGYMPPRQAVPREPGQFPLVIYGTDYEKACARYEADPGSVLRDLWGGNFSLRRTVFLEASAHTAVPRELPYHQDQVLGWQLRSFGCTGIFDRALGAEHRYERSPDQFFVDCRRRGEALAGLRAIAPDDVEIDPRAYSGPAVRQASRILSLRPDVARQVLRWATTSAGRVHWWPMETRVAKLLRNAESYAAFTGAVADHP